MNSLKYLIVIFISIIFIGILSFYIVNKENINNKEVISKENKQIIKTNDKEFIYTKEIKLNDNNILLKYYGEVLNNKKNITIEVYLNNVFGGEYNYINNYDNSIEYKKILSKYNSLDNEAYLIDNYIIVSLSKVDNTYKNTLILFNKDNIKIDEYLLYNKEDLIIENNNLFIIEDNIKYKLNIINNSFSKELYNGDDFNE